MVPRGLFCRVTALVCVWSLFVSTAFAQPAPPPPTPPAPTPPAPKPPTTTPPAPTPTPTPTSTPAPTPTTTPTSTSTAAANKAPSTCTELDACIAACKDGAGSFDACVKAGELALSGRKGVLDAAKALTAFRNACALDEKWIPIRDREGDPRGCLRAAELLDTGWLFDVEKDPVKSRLVMDRAVSLGRSHCNDTDFSRCDTAALALVARDKKLPAAKADVPSRIIVAERGCTKGRQLTACKVLYDTSWLLEAVESMKPEAKRMRQTADAGAIRACLDDGDVDACNRVEYKTEGMVRMNINTMIDKKCKEGVKQACAAQQYDLIVKHRKEPEKLAAASKALLGYCDGDGHTLCSTVADAMTNETKAKRLGISFDAAAGVALAVRRCDLGDLDGCRVAATTYKDGPEALRDPIKSRGYADRSCMMTKPEWSCRECKDDPTLPSCVKRAAYSEHDQCFAGQAGACQRIATRFDKGDGVIRSLDRAADYLRKGCDAAERSACVALDELCLANPTLPATTCQQALIHSDLFYEAEYQMGAGGDADLIDGDKVAKPATPTQPAPVTVGSVVSATPTSIKRAKLDADLVVDVVLDRVRQAAIQLVVDQLLTSQRKAKYRYLRDLLEQGASLLAEPSTLRREKFQDLGMIVVRAFVASNLVDGLYPTAKELMAAPEIGATIARGQKELGLADPKKPLPEVMHGYLVDVAYYWLGETRLFGRTNRNTKVQSLECPWTSGQGAILCTQLAERANAERAIGVAKVLDGLRLARTLRDGGFDDLRRLIEAASRSRTIADFKNTPGLTLSQWRARLVDDTRAKLGTVRTGLFDIRTLTRTNAWGENGLDLPTLSSRAVNAREALKSPAVRMVLGTSSVTQILRITSLVERAMRDAEGVERAQSVQPPPSQADDALVDVPLGSSSVIPQTPATTTPPTATPPATTPPAPPRNESRREREAREKREREARAAAAAAASASASANVGGFDPRLLILQTLRRDVMNGFSSWDPRDLGELGKRVDTLAAKVDGIMPSVDRLEAAIADITALLARFPNPDGSPSWDVANLPLYAAPDLARELRATSAALVQLDDGLRSVFPGEVQAQVRFARSASVRLLGFLDLMERVARSSQLTQKTGDVIGALRILGTYRTRVFDAPLYDVLEPVLDSIKTHEPMNLELLYSVISHVRLDTLIGKLRASKNPCDSETSVDCWTTRLVHALQESVERSSDGGLTIDGGKFATRLAQHGDDFRRKHNWRGYLHLTVGVGALYSDPVGDSSSERRSVPLISEQIGFGLASPSFFGDRLTFKVGAAASGLLYRAVLDSEESNSIMVHPLFMALDIGNLVELYVSPATLMVYPPKDEMDTKFRWAVTAGVSVPISAYLERL